MGRTPEEAAAAREAMLAELVRASQEWLDEPELEPTEPDARVEFIFELIHMARALEYHLSRIANTHHMTAMQARFAWILAATPWPIPQQDVEVALGLSQSGVSRMVQRMRDRGLIEGEVSSWDARGAVINLTAHGHKQWDLLRDELARVSDELTHAVGPSKESSFRKRAKAVTALDERHSYFESLRDPRGILS